MTRIRALRARVSDERDVWMSVFLAWGGREIFAHPDYVSLFAEAHQEPLCLFIEDEDACVILPLVMTPLSHLEWHSGEPGWDAVTPYGYGGPFLWGQITQDGVSRVWEAIQRWAHENKLVTTFLRRSVFPEQALPFAAAAEPFCEVLASGVNVVRPLTCDETTLWQSYDHKVRKNVNRAKREGLKVVVDQGGEHLAEFLSIYYATMDRNNASETFYFSESFFRQFAGPLREYALFFHVLDGSEIVSTELVLNSSHHLYSFLGGTKSDAYPKRPNDLLKHEICLWGVQNDKKAFLLGGGYGGQEDGIFKYKRTFSPEGVVPFYLMRMTHDADAVEDLCQMRRQWGAAHRTEWNPATGFFPPYRAKTIEIVNEGSHE